MKRIGATLVAVMVTAMGSIAWAQNATVTAKDFTTMAASSDMFEIQSSELALQKAESSAVKEFAQMMISDHTKASKELMAAAQQDGISTATGMTTKHAQQLESLNGASGASFDAAYVDAQVAGHEEAVALMTSYAEGGESPALKAHAQKSAPIIKTHLEHVQKIDKGD